MDKKPLLLTIGVKVGSSRDGFNPNTLYQENKKTENDFLPNQGIRIFLKYNLLLINNYPTFTNIYRFIQREKTRVFFLFFGGVNGSTHGLRRIIS